MLGARKRDARAHNELFTAHYIGALLPNIKPRPSLQRLLVDVDAKPKQKMDWRQMKAAFSVALPRS